MKHNLLNSAQFSALEIPQAILKLLNYCESAGIYIVNREFRIQGIQGIQGEFKGSASLICEQEFKGCAAEQGR